MSILLLIDRDVQDQEIIKQSLLPNVTLIDKLEDVLTKNNVARIGIAFHNEGMSFVPFSPEVGTKVAKTAGQNVQPTRNDPEPKPSSASVPKPKYSCYTNAFVDYLKELKTKFNNVCVDIISCAMKNKLFDKETAEISLETGVQLQYSTNQTGNGEGADWILESNNQNLIGLYFTDNILSWRHTLIYTVATGSDVVSLFNEDILTYSDGIYTMTASNTMANPYRTIMLRDGEIFDGGGHTLTIDINRSGIFIMDSGSKNTTIKNLTVSFDDYVNTAQASSKIGGGGIVRPFQSNFTVDSCVVTNVLREYCGGICGSYCSNFDIVNCESNGTNTRVYFSGDTELTEYAEHVGGIVAAYCSNFNVVNCDSYVNIRGNNSQDMSGGIVGYSCKSFTVTDSINYGAMESLMMGGIVGGQCTDFVVKNCRNNVTEDEPMFYGSGGIVGSCSNNFVVENCTNNYDVGFNGNNSASCGGIVGYGCFDFTVKKCKNNGTVSGWGSGGIVGNRCSNFKLYDCVNTGNVTGSSCGGICGANVGCSTDVPLFDHNYIFEPAYTYGKNIIEINNCVNYGNVTSWQAGGICGKYVGRIMTYVDNDIFPYPYNKMPNDIKITLNNCVNHGNLTSSSGGGIIGSYAGYISIGDDDNIYGTTHSEITINNCETKSGCLCGESVLDNNVNGYTSGYNNGTFNSHSKLIIKSSYVPSLSDRIVLSLGSQLSEAEVLYYPPNGAPTNLIQNVSFSAIRQS